jgi:hypothetical protein
MNRRKTQANAVPSDLAALGGKGDINGISYAERAIKEYIDVTPLTARAIGSRLLQADVLAQRDAVQGRQHDFAMQ